LSARPGKVRDCLQAQQKLWIDSLKRIAQSAIRAGEFREDIDCDQFAFDLYSLLLGCHYYTKLLDDDHADQKLDIALERLLTSYR